jgi:hypothetical protein
MRQVELIPHSKQRGQPHLDPLGSVQDSCVLIEATPLTTAFISRHLALQPLSGTIVTTPSTAGYQLEAHDRLRGTYRNHKQIP